MAQRMMRVNATLNHELVKKIDAFAHQQLEDRSTAIRQLVAKGLWMEKEEQILRGYQHGRFTLREVGELMGIGYWEVQDLLQRRGVPIQDLAEVEVQSRIKKLAH